MRLLPNVYIDIDDRRYELSLQYPFTLNGRLITRVTGDGYMQLNFQYDSIWDGAYCQRGNRSIEILNDGNIVLSNDVNEQIVVQVQVLKDIITRPLTSYINQYGPVWIGNYEFERAIPYVNCEQLLQFLIMDTLQMRNAQFYENAIGVLRGQGRAYAYDRRAENTRGRRASNFAIGNACINMEILEAALPSEVESVTSANNIATVTSTTAGVCTASTTTIPNEELFCREYTYIRPHTDNGHQEVPIFNSFRRPRQFQYIHAYNYIPPEYKKYYMPEEHPATTLLLGAEIEVAGNSSDVAQYKDDHVKKCIQIMNGSDSDEENFIYSTSDSTVQIELDTMPCSLEYHKQKMNYEELFKYLDELGYKGHDCSSAGLHIHANRSYLGGTKLVQELTIAKILYILEKFNDEICLIARRDCVYSQFIGKKEMEDSAMDLYSKYNKGGKRVALNLTHKDTIEFRMFKSTLKYETFILTLEFVKSIIDYAKKVNIENIETMKWQDLMGCSSPAVQEYYKVRKEKEEAKARKAENEGKIDAVSKWLSKEVTRIKKEYKHSVNYLERNKLQRTAHEYKKILKDIKKGRYDMDLINRYYETYAKTKPVISLDGRDLHIDWSLAWSTLLTSRENANNTCISPNVFTSF